VAIGPTVSDGSDEPPLFSHDFLLVRTPLSAGGHGMSLTTTPATTTLEVAPGIQWGEVRHDIAARIVDASRYREPFPRVETITYGFIRLRTPVAGWDDDNQLTKLLFLSHLVHPNEGGFEYSARVVTNEAHEVKHCYVAEIPPFYARTSLPIAADSRRWLTDADMRKLRDLAAAYERVRPSLADTKLGLVISTYVETPFMLNIRSRALLLLTMLEGLVNTDSERSTNQFTTRVKALAKELGLKAVDKKWADKLYGLRSLLAHGSLMMSRASDAGQRQYTEFLERLELVDLLLRRVIQKALLEDGFRETVLDPSKHWPVWGTACPQCRAKDANLKQITCRCGQAWTV
jgi:hypothetical protein